MYTYTQMLGQFSLFFSSCRTWSYVSVYLIVFKNSQTIRMQDLCTYADIFNFDEITSEKNLLINFTHMNH